MVQTGTLHIKLESRVMWQEGLWDPLLLYLTAAQSHPSQPPMAGTGAATDHCQQNLYTLQEQQFSSII